MITALRTVLAIRVSEPRLARFDRRFFALTLWLMQKGRGGQRQRRHQSAYGERVAEAASGVEPTVDHREKGEPDRRPDLAGQPI